MQALRIDAEPLQQKRCSFADGIPAMLGQFFKEILMAEQGVRYPRCLKGVKKTKLSFYGHEPLG